MMKVSKVWMMTALVGVLSFGSLATLAADKTDKSEKKETKAYPLDKCLVSDEKLGEHGKPYVFTEKGQEIKLCCKDCLSDFKKDKAKYLKKIEEAPTK